jgi:selenium metabolism protein YedF
MNTDIPHLFEKTNYAVVIRSEFMGNGDDKLGALIMRAFINSIPQLDRLPSLIVLYNSGVKLAIQNVDTADTLIKLQQAGVSILLCGTCVDYFEIREQIAAGQISHMLTINNTLAGVDKIIYP